MEQRPSRRQPPLPLTAANSSRFPDSGVWPRSFSSVVGFSTLEGKAVLEPAAALASPAAAWPCPGGLSRSMQILCASATPTRGPWQGKHRSAAAAAAVVGRGGDPRQSVGGRELLSVSSPEGLRHRPSFCCEINPHRSPREQRRGRGRPGVPLPAARRWAPITASCTSPSPGRLCLELGESQLLPGGSHPAAKKRWGNRTGPTTGPPRRQESPNFVLALGSHPPPRASLHSVQIADSSSLGD